VLVSRVSRNKSFVSLDGIADTVKEMLASVHNELVERVQKNVSEKTHVATTMEEFMDHAENHPGFIKAMWCGETECEEKVKELTGGVKSRCIPFNEENLAPTCVCCGKPAKHMLVWGRQY
jgi:prolyl-tRNA synthetase